MRILRLAAAASFGCGLWCLTGAATVATSKLEGTSLRVPDPAPLATTIRQITLATRDLVYDPVRKVIYASVPSTAGAIGNSVTLIDPFEGVVGPSVFVGSGPNKLALSDNAQTLYVGLDSAAAVRRFDTATRTPGLLVSLGGDTSGPFVALDMFVLPGTPGSIAVLRRNIGSSSGRGVAIFDDAIQRPTTTANASGDFIEPSTDPTRMYGLGSCCYDVYRMAISGSGVTIAATYSDLLSSNVDIEADEDLLYSASGRVVNPETGQIVGAYSVSGSSSTLLVLPEARARRVYFLASQSGSSPAVQVFDRDTFLSLGTIPVPGLNGTPTSLIRWGASGLAFRTSTDQVILVESPLIGSPSVASDFESDFRTDIAVWRPSDTNWYVRYSSLGSVNAFAFGAAGDTITPGDYDGDGSADVAVWRPSAGTWHFVESSTGTLRMRQLGLSSDLPVPRDFDGDRKTDPAVYRPADGLWQVLQSSNGTLRGMLFGLPADKPVPNDFDGDRAADFAVYRPSTGIWYILRSSDFGFVAEQFGMSTDTPVSADYDGDGKADIAVYRPSDGIWYVRRSSDNGFRATQFGIGTDIPVPGDYDGDGKADIAVFRDGIWYVLQSSNSVFFSVPFGQAGDVPVPFGYIR
jgi:hypothetical protein